MKLQNWSPGYAIVKRIVSVAHRLMYGKYEVIGKENIKSGKPIILAPNHQNALNDALIVIFSTPFQPVWLARADIFASKILGKILYFMKMSPVYRIRDGKDSLGKNEEVFKTAIKILKNNKQLALFPEATHSGKRQALAHKKAVPRIAFMAGEETNFELDVKIVPTGIYYSSYYEFDKDALVYFGKPLNLRDYKEFYEKSPAEATIKLRKDLNEAVLAISFNIPSKHYYFEYEFLRDVIGRSERIKNADKSSSVWNKIRQDQEVVDHIYSNEQEHTHAFDTLLEVQKEYQSNLNQTRVSDKAVVAGPISFYKLMYTGIGLLLLSPLALIGFVAHYFLYAYPLSKIKKRIKEEAFWGSVHFVVALFGGILLYTIYAVLLSITFHAWYVTLGILLVLPITAKIAWRWNNTLKFLKMRLVLRGINFKTLKELRIKVLDAYQNLNK